MNRPIIAFFIAIIMPLLLAACGAESNGGKPSSEGTLTGTISIGPVCPVEPCDQSAGSIYVGRELVLLSTDGDPIRVPLADDGSFKVNLEPTTYLIRLEGCDYLGCNQAFPVEKTVVSGETVTLNVNLDTGIRSPERNQGIGQLVSDLEGLGAVVSLGDSLSQPFFSVAGQEVTVNREVVQVFTYASPKEARSDADLVDKTGFEVGTTMVSWVAPPHFFLPHFFLKDNLLVLYVGVNDAVISLLQEALGPQIAGGEITSDSPREEVGFSDQDPMSMPGAPAPLGLARISLPNDDASIAALFDRLPPTLLDRERADENPSSTPTRINLSYGKTTPVGCGIVGFQANDVSTGDFYPAGWTAERVIAIFASGVDRGVQAFGRDGELFWVNWQTSCSVSPSSSLADFMEMTTWGKVGSSWVFSASAQNTEGRGQLVAAFVEASG